MEDFQEIPEKRRFFLSVPLPDGKTEVMEALSVTYALMGMFQGEFFFDNLAELGGKSKE